MRKINDILTSDTIQNYFGSIMECAPAAVMVRLEPHSLKESPDCLSDVEVRGIRRKVEDVESPFPPLRNFPRNLSLAVNRGIVKHHESRQVNPSGETVQPFRKSVAGDGIRGVESFIPTIRGYDSEDVQPSLPLDGTDTSSSSNCQP